MVEVIFIGTSAGVPSKDRGMPSIAIHANELLLFDCGEGTQRQMMKFKVPYGSVNAIFITHPHLDHYLGVFGLMETIKLTLPHKTVKIFSPEGLDLSKKNVELRTVKKGKLYENKEFEIHAFPVKHVANSFGFIIQEKDRVKFDEKKAKSLGIVGRMFKEIQEKGSLKIGKKLIKLKDITWIKKGRKIVYTGDTEYCKEVLEAAKDADLLIHDCSFSSQFDEDAEKRNHSTSEDAARVAKKAKVKQLILTHISARYKDASQLLQEATKVFKNTIIAEDGAHIKL